MTEVQVKPPKETGYTKILRAQVRPLRKALRAYYKNIAIGMFEWKGFNETIPIRYPERWLYENGCCVYCEPDGMDGVLLPVALTNINKNLYGEPAEWRAVGIGEYAGKINSKTLDDTNSVLIRNDQLYENSANYVNYMIEQMINVELTMRMNINANKMPFMFRGNQNTALQNKNTFIDIYECEPVIFKEAFAKDEFEILNNQVPFIAPELSKIYDIYGYRILSYLGVKSIPIEKNERLLVDEIGANNEEKEYVRDARLDQREISTKQLKRVFNLDVSVKYKEVKLDGIYSMFGAQQTGGEGANSSKGNERN